jgi:hypothetical protein
MYSVSEGVKENHIWFGSFSDMMIQGPYLAVTHATKNLLAAILNCSYA